ncbi:hypothetical protein Tco_1486096, partial [Tanacetum coccineum]
DIDTQICSSLWKGTIPMKVKLFIWLAWFNLLPTEVWEAASFTNISSIQNSDNVNGYFIADISDHRNRWEAFLMICAIRLLQEFHDVAICGNAQFETNVDPLASTWHPPHYSFVKVNCDDAWFPSSKQAGLGFVARNSKGEMIVSGAKHVEYSD